MCSLFQTTEEAFVKLHVSLDPRLGASGGEGIATLVMNLVTEVVRPQIGQIVNSLVSVSLVRPCFVCLLIPRRYQLSLCVCVVLGRFSRPAMPGLKQRSLGASGRF